MWTHTSGGFHHDGRFATLRGVNHYDAHFGLLLSDREKDDLIEYLKILVTRRSMAIEHLAGQRTAAGARSRSGVLPDEFSAGLQLCCGLSVRISDAEPRARRCKLYEVTGGDTCQGTDTGQRKVGEFDGLL